MNRRERRVRLREGARLARRFAESYRCPDCCADTVLRKEETGVYTLKVFHDQTCPTYRAKLARRGA